MAEARTSPPDGIGRDGELLLVEGVALLQEGQAEPSIATLRRADSAHYCPICILPELARAYELAGRPD